MMKTIKAQMQKALLYPSTCGAKAFSVFCRVWFGTLAMVMLIAPMIASAATYTVTKTADTKDGTCDADCSLREAIDAANGAGAGPHTINIPAGTYTISGAGDDTNTAGDFDINVAIDFVGAGSASTILDGNLADRIFHVRIAAIPVSVTGMKFIRGRAGASTGGGINSLSGSITITDSIFDDCDGGQGGAIYTNNASTITISGSTFTNSNGTGAGGSVNGGSVSVTSSTFTSNATSGGHGGAIYASANALAGGSLIVTGTSSFSSNSASGYGGAIYASNTASITGATFNLNTATTASQRGGAVYVAALGQFTNCTITNNTAAAQGGGIDGSSASSAIEINNSTISGNTASTGNGGGVYSQTTLTITGTTIIDSNTAGAAGGGAYANGAATVDGATINNNHSTTGTATVRGGGIGTGGNLTMSNSSVTNNWTFGGGGGVSSGAIVNISNSTISGNYSSGSTGGGVYAQSTSTFTNSTVSNNQTKAASAGGGVYSNGLFTANGSTFSGNSTGTVTAGGDGGAVYAAAGASITSSTFTSNTSTARGGAVFNNSAAATVSTSDSTFTGNSGTYGGSIYAAGGTSITRTTFSSNVASLTGGAIYSVGAASNFYGANTFTGNHATGSGSNAGGCIYTNQNLTINDAGSVFSGNYGGGSGGCIWGGGTTTNINAATTFDGNYTTAAGGGGAIISNGGTMTNVTFVNNHALDYGGAFYPLTTYTINNSTFEGNYLTSAVKGGGAIILKNAAYTVTINNSTFSGNNAGTGPGGAISTETGTPAVALYNSTFYNNTATGSQALYSATANKILLYNSIVAHPSSAALCSGTGRGSTSKNVDFNNSGNCVASDAYRITTDPLLSALAYNGGSTKTMALQSTSSSAYDASATGATASDQRGVAAIGTRDIGAYEYSGVAGDTVAPSPISTLATGTIGSTTVQLTWTAPGDDYSSGTATTYDVRYSTSPINEGNWASATAATGEPSPSVAGTSESFTVTGLSASTLYYFAIKTSDEVPNTSALSNVVSATTTAAAATTTLATGTDPGNTSLAPGGAATNAGAFSFQTSSGTDVITAATVTLAAGTSGGLSLVEITNAAGTTVYGSVANPASDTPAITLSTNTLTATTTLTEYRIRVTPKSHANMPAPAGSSYAVTARISAFTGTNAQAGTDTAGTTVTIDNLSTANVTASTATAGNTQVVLAWTNPADADLHSIVVLRRATSAVADVPVEGTTYVVGNTIGTATVACVVASPTATCTDTGLTNGTAYHYLIFAKDSNGNYSATGVVPTGSPATPTAGITISGTLYSDEGTTVIATGPTVRLIANGASVGTAVANGSGVYSITASVNSGDALIAYIDSNGGTVGNAVTVSNGVNLSGLNIYADRLITRHDNGGSLTNALMSTAKGAYVDTDILYSVAGGNLTANAAGTELFVWTGHTFAPGGTITTTHVDINGTLDAAANAINVAGNWDATGGIFTSTGTVTFNATSGTISITPGGVDANHDFQNIVFNDAAGSATFQLQGALAAANDFTVTDGIVNTNSGGNYAVTVGHDLTIDGGNLTANGSTITIVGSLAVANVSGLFTKGTSTVDLTGTGNIISPNYGNRLHIVKMAAAGQTTTMTGSFRTRILELGTGTLSNSSGQINIGDDAGTGETVLVNAGVSTSGNVFSLMVGGANPVNIQGGNYSKVTLTGFSSTVTVTNASLTLNRFDMTASGIFNLNGFDLNVATDLNIGFSSNTATFNAGSGTITVGSVFVESSGGTPTLNLNSATLYNAGVWNVQAGGTVNPGTSTVVFNGTNQTITGSTTFNHFTKSVASAATLTFAAGSTTTINGTATINGASGQLLSLVSSSPGTYWNFNLGAASTKTISYVSVTDSDASGSDASKKPVSPTNSSDGGHNVSWFGGTPSLTFLKSADVTYDPYNNTTNPKYIPGSYALFTMRATNSGVGTVDNNTMIITDPIPANTEVFTGNLSGGAPFIFVDGTPVSGLSCAFIALGNFADCMDFSNNGGTTWTYVPNGDFDSAVTNVRFSLSGTMNGTGGGNPYFDLKFRVRVK